MLANFDSRAVRRGFVVTVARQLGSQDKPVTAYRVARALNTSVYLARKELDDMVSEGTAHTTQKKHRPNVEKTVYSIDFSHYEDIDFTWTSQYITNFIIATKGVK